MRATVEIECVERRPAKRACALLTDCEVEKGTAADYKRLSAYHYRDHRYPPAVHAIYRARHVPSGRVVGVIVYAAPALNLGVRNKIFGDQYKIGKRGANDLRAKRLNRELELIIRVVVHPTFRGIGLGRRLVAESLPDRPYKYVEMSAAMGAVNPFAEKAGMQPVVLPRPAGTERILSALRSVGIKEEHLGSPQVVATRLRGLAERPRQRVERELLAYETRWIKARSNRDFTLSVDGAIRRVTANALLGSMYYLWENPKWEK